MSIESAVRERHAFEDRLKNFLTLASIMTDREIELALSRLADMVAHMPDCHHVNLRGEVLTIYARLRRENQRDHRAFKRVIFNYVPGMARFDNRIDRDRSEYYVRCIAHFPLLVDGQDQPPGPAVGPPTHETVLKLAP